jgi:hypothetical protein
LLSSPVLLKNDYGSGGIYMEYLDVKCGQRGGVTLLPDRYAFIIPAAEEDPFAGERAIKDPEEAALDFLSDDRRPLVLVSNNRDFGVFFSQSIVSMSFFLTHPAGVPKRGNFQHSAAIPSVLCLIPAILFPPANGFYMSNRTISMLLIVWMAGHLRSTSNSSLARTRATPKCIVSGLSVIYNSGIPY